MKNISYYILGVVLLGVGVVSFWIYGKYFSAQEEALISFVVSEGDIRESVHVRGEVVAQKALTLEFPFAGTVEKVYVDEGAEVKQGDLLMKLDAAELSLEAGRLEAVLEEQEALLSKLLAGATAEDVRISATKLAATEQALVDAQKTVLDAGQSAFTATDDAIHNKSDQFFDRPRLQNPAFRYPVTDTQLKINLETARYPLELMLEDWNKKPFQTLSEAGALGVYVQANLLKAKNFLTDLAAAINNLAATGSFDTATLAEWKANVLAARTGVDTAISTLSSAQEKLRTAESARALAQSELDLKQSKPRPEDIQIRKAQIEQTKHVLSSVQEKIRKATLRAPTGGIVQKIILKEHEVFTPGMSALLFVSSVNKVQADISELDIRKVSDKRGNEALVQFDAFPGESLKGKVSFIEPKEVIKDGDTYFRTDVSLEDSSKLEVRPGMNADVVLYGVLKEKVLMIPLLAVDKKGTESIVHVARGATTKEEARRDMLEEREVSLGISDGEYVEVVSGLSAGEVIVLSTE